MSTYLYCGHDGDSYTGRTWRRTLATDRIALDVGKQITMREDVRRVGVFREIDNGSAMVKVGDCWPPPHIVRAFVNGAS